jgi:hypothetical protein
MHLELLSEGVRQRFRVPLGPPCIAPIFRDTRHTAHCGTRFHVRRCGAVSRSDCRSSDGAELFPGHQSDWKARHDIDRDPNTGGWSGSDQPYEIVVLVGNVKAIGLRDAPFPTLYFNMFQENRLVDQFQLHTIVNPASVSRTVRRIVQDVLKTVSITRVTTLADQGDSNIVPNVLLQLYRKCFGMLGAALAGVELYGPNTKYRPFRLQVERGRCDPRDERISCRPALSLSNATEKGSSIGRARLGVVIRRALIRSDQKTEPTPSSTFAISHRFKERSNV